MKNMMAMEKIIIDGYIRIKFMLQVIIMATKVIAVPSTASMSPKIKELSMSPKSLDNLFIKMPEGVESK